MSNPIFPLKLEKDLRVYKNMRFNKENNTMGIGFHYTNNCRGMLQINSNVSTAYVLVLILEGQATYTDHYGNEYRLNAGQGFQRIPKKNHKLLLKKGKPYSECYIHLPKSFYLDIKEFGGSNENSPVIDFDLKSNLLDQMLETAYLLNSTRDKSLPIYLIELYTMVLKFLQQSELVKTPSFHLKLVEEVCEILDNTITENIKLPDIAKGFNISYERLRKVFKDVMHITMGEYRIKARIQQSQTLLLKREMNINEIAQSLGYPDSFSFSKQFKKERGLSPEKYLKHVTH
jgi:AraC family transcriptional regulator, arabinose operon regulatory protein